MEAPVIGRVASDALFRLLVEHVKDYAIFLLDPEGHVMSWNEGAERIKGYRSEEIVGQHFSRFYPEEDLATRKPWRALETARREGRFLDEGWRVRKDGSRLWASVVLTALHSDDGTLVGFAKVTRDLTERRRVEEERIDLLRKERAARERAEAALARLQAARERADVAEDAVRTRDEFISVAAHELKTPVTAAKAAVQLLVRRATRVGIDPSLAATLEIVERQMDKLGLLMTHLLESARIQADRVPLERAPTDVAAMAREVAGMIAAATGRRIDVAGPDSLEIVADRLRLEQVVTNLIDNAVKYSPASEPVSVTLARPDAGSVEIAVRDRGPGVAAQDRQRLFERYFQAHTDRSGMGLGLYISKVIVEKHGGTLRAEFPADGGSRFVISLPLQPPSEEAGTQRAVA